MFKKSHQILFIILTISLSLTACSTGKPEDTNLDLNVEPSLTEGIEKVQPSETPTATEMPPTATEMPPTETPLLTATAEPGISSGDSEHFVMIGDLERSYLLHVPRRLSTKKAVPVIFAFHGITESPEDIQEFSGFNNTVDRAKLSKALIVYPAGMVNSWNTGEPEGLGYANEYSIDDFEFINEILLDLGSSFNIDTKRIFAMGFSQGGVFAYRLACEMSDTFAAIASVSGPMGDIPCEPTRSVSVLHIHGLSDTTVPFVGGGPFDFPGAENGIETWVALNHCTDSSIEEEGIVAHTVYSPCDDGSIVELHTIEGQDHFWPSLASMTIWTFFELHPMH